MRNPGARHPFDPAAAARVIARIEAGELLRDLWRDETLPARFTLKTWRAQNPEFAALLREAVNAARSRRYKAKSPYGPATRAEICRRIEAGATLGEIVSDPDMPGAFAIHTWLNTDPDFRWDYAIARETWGEGPGAELANLSRLSQRHSLGHILDDEVFDRTGLCPCRECRTEQASAQQRGEPPKSRHVSITLLFRLAQLRRRARQKAMKKRRYAERKARAAGQA